MAATFLATVDERPYFDKVLRFGVENAVISGDRFRQILADGAKGIVQIANFFGTAHLRTDLEIARERMVNLLSLYLEDVSDGDLLAAALSLKEKSLLSHSKGGSDMLRRLSALPQHPTIGLHEVNAEDQRNDLNNWTYTSALDLRTYRKELQARQAVQLEIDYAKWLLERFGAAWDDDSFPSETFMVFSSAMLVLCVKDVKDAPLRMPTRLDFVRLIAAAQKKNAMPSEARVSQFMAEVPAEFTEVADKALEDFALFTMPEIREPWRTAENLLEGDDALYFYILDDVDEDSQAYERIVSGQWHKITAGDSDDPKVIATVLLRVATGLPPGSKLLKREARDIVRNFRARGCDSNAVIEFIETTCPLSIQPDLKRIWEEDLLPDASEAIADTDPQYPDAYMARAVAYLRRTCRATWAVDDE